MSIIDKLLGRKKRTANVIADEIANQRSMIAASRGRIEGARVDRRDAIEAFDAARHRAADETISEEGREIERREHAIGVLEAAHAAQVAIEAREAVDRDIDALNLDAAALTKRIQTEYPAAANVIGAIVRDLRTHYARHTRLEAAAKEVGVPFDVDGPERFRRSASDVQPYSLIYLIGNLPGLQMGDPSPNPAPLPEHILCPEAAMYKRGRR